MERSDSNDILGTYFRPRRAAELIHQNQVLNLWKDYKKNGQNLGSWMGPAMPNHLRSPNAMAWQPIPSSAAMNSVRNGNTSSRHTLDDLKNKPFYGVRPTLNVQLNSNSLATNDNMHTKLNSPHYSNETGSTLLSLRNPIMPTPFMRDNFG